MKRVLTVEFSRAWVFKHRSDELLPTAVLVNELKKLVDVETKHSDYAKVAFIYDDKKINGVDLNAHIRKILKEKYPDDNMDGLYTYSDVEEAGQTDEPKEGSNKHKSVEDAQQDDGESQEKESEEKDEIGDVIRRILGKEDDVKDDEADVVLRKINELVGMSEFKALASEIASIADEVKTRNACDVVTYQSYLFSIGDGGGLSTCLQLFAQLLNATKIKKMRYDPVAECRLLPVKESMEPFEPVLELLRRGDSSAMRIICIDISEWMNNMWSGFFRQFLQLLEKSADSFIYVFKIPFVEKNVFAKIRESLNDLFYIRAISFPPFSQSELEACAKAEIEKYGFKVQKTAWKYFADRINMEKSDGKFYGLNTVKKVVRELLYKKQLSNAVGKRQNSVISAKDMSVLCYDSIDSTLSGEMQLERLVGNDAIKARVKEIVAQIELAYQTNGDRPCVHMRFVGNPGTGKTTVARIVGKILKERGILRVGGFYEHSGRDFCGRYIGETAPKTASICRDAYGSVLFIDEAYSLYRGAGDTKDYGREALDTLIAEMENHRTDFVVIMAGYTDDMDVLMKGNAGLASRMPYTIEFPNFTRLELFEIYKSMVVGKTKHDGKIFESARSYFDSLPDEVLKSKEFSNARFVRNLFERTWAKASMRCQLEKTKDVVLTKDDFDRAISDNEFIITKSKRIKMGFDN